MTDKIAAKQSQEEKKEDEDEEEEKSTSGIMSKARGFIAFDEMEMSKDVHLAEDALKLINDISG